MWPSGIVPDIPEVAKVTRIVGIKVFAENNLEDEDAPGNGGQIPISDVDVELQIGTGGCSSSEGVCRVSTTQKENLDMKI